MKGDPWIFYYGYRMHTMQQNKEEEEVGTRSARRIKMAENSKGKKKIYETEEAEVILKALLKEAGFHDEAPDLVTAWETFKKMCEYEFDCAEDELLFETGVYDFTGKELYYLYIVRQFTIEVEGEYDYLEQLRMEFSYEPEGELKEMEEIISTFEFDDDFGEFIKAVEKSPAFLLPEEKYAPVGFELFTEEI